MRPDPTKLLQSEVISPTVVLVAVHPQDGKGSALMVSHKDALAFAHGLIAQLEPREAPAHG